VRKVLVGIITVAIVAVALFFVLGGNLGLMRKNAAPMEPPPTESQPARRLVFDGRVVPARTVRLLIPSGGIIAAVSIQEGDKVTNGQLLVQVDDTLQKVAISQAEVNVRRAEAQLAQAKAEPQELEVASLEAAVAAADAALKEVAPQDVYDQLNTARLELTRAVSEQLQAQAVYDRMKEGQGFSSSPYAKLLELVRTSVNEAGKKLTVLANKGVNPAVAAARFEYIRALTQLEMVRLGPNPETLKTIETEIVVARTELDRVKANQSNLELRAPFAGTIVSLEVVTGLYVVPGTPLVTLADFSTILVETEDVTELDILRIGPGAVVTVTFDAIPDLALRGQVKRINLVGQNRQGDITYTIVIELDQKDERLRWNMTASIVFDGL
jgi:HlyD family secretion protein